MKRQKKSNQYNDQKKKDKRTNIDPKKTNLEWELFSLIKKQITWFDQKIHMWIFCGLFCVFNQVFNFYNTSILILYQLRLPIMKETVNNSTRRKLHANRSLQAKQIQIMKKISVQITKIRFIFNLLCKICILYYYSAPQSINIWIAFQN